MITLAAYLLLTTAVSAGGLLFAPLDERFTTRVAFENLAALTPYQLTSMPDSLMPSLKQAASPDEIVDWFTSEVGTAEGSVLSLEMLLYGGLIQSRISNDTTEQVKARFDKVVQKWRLGGGSCQMYASQVVMRIPSYDGDFEEPWFWAMFGEDIFNYSFFTDKYRTTQDSDDLAKA